MSKLPFWLKKPLSLNSSFFETKALLAKCKINTVCTEAKCPNQLQCFAKKRATFLALGKFCTRKCAFCDISFSKNPPPLDENEPINIALSAKKLNLSHIVITMVTRDDLPDFGASQIYKIILECKKQNPKSTLELLSSDLQGSYSCLDHILLTKPNIFNHNIETVEALTPKIRNNAEYKRSLTVLRYVKERDPSILTKSGFMVGFGETEEEVKNTLLDLKKAKCDIITIGQYLRPSKKCMKVVQFVPPDLFKKYEDFAKELGFKGINIGPFVRSSFNAEEYLQSN